MPDAERLAKGCIRRVFQGVGGPLATMSGHDGTGSRLLERAVRARVTRGPPPKKHPACFPDATRKEHRSYLWPGLPGAALQVLEGACPSYPHPLSSPPSRPRTHCRIWHGLMAPATYGAADPHPGTEKLYRVGCPRWGASSPEIQPGTVSGTAGIRTRKPNQVQISSLQFSREARASATRGRDRSAGRCAGRQFRVVWSRPDARILAVPHATTASAASRDTPRRSGRRRTRTGR